MKKATIHIPYLQPSSLAEAVGLFFPAKRRQTGVKVWKWFTKNPAAHPITILELAVELTGNRDLMRHYQRLLAKADDPFSYEAMLELKKKLIEIAAELGVDFARVLDDVEYAISTMRTIGVLHPIGNIVVYNPTWLTRFLKRIAWEIEKELG